MSVCLGSLYENTLRNQVIVKNVTCLVWFMILLLILRYHGNPNKGNRYYKSRLGKQRGKINWRRSKQK